MDERFDSRDESLREIDKDLLNIERMDSLKEREDSRNELDERENRTISREDIISTELKSDDKISIPLKPDVEILREDYGRSFEIKLSSKDGELTIDDKSLSGHKLFDGTQLRDIIDTSREISVSDKDLSGKIDVRLTAVDERGESVYRIEPERLVKKEREELSFDPKMIERINTKIDSREELTYREQEEKDKYDKCVLECKRIEEKPIEIRIPERPDIDRALTDAKFTEGANTVMQILRDNGGESYLVGGCTRDACLGRPSKDEDITTNLTPDRVTEIFEREDYRVVPTGLQHGTVTIMVPDENKQLVGYEITTYRVDGKYEDGRHPSEVSFTPDLLEDLNRRDLTINAIAVDGRGEVVDPFSGREDLKSRVINTVGDPNDRFKEDALRMMRAVRFSSQLDFKIDDKVKDAIKDRHEDIRQVSRERVHDELTKILKSDHPSEGLRELHDLGLMKEVMPALDRCFDEREGRQDHPYHIGTVGEHTLKVVENCPNDLVTRTAAMFHDIGKVETRGVNSRTGNDSFIGHAERSGELTKSIMDELKFTSKERDEVSRLTVLHKENIEPTRESVEKFVLRHQDIEPRTFERLIDLQKADVYGQSPDMRGDRIEKLEQVRDLYREITSGPYREKDLAINGRDLMSIKENAKGERIDFKGPELKVAKQELLAYVIKDPSRNNYMELRDYSLSHAKQIKNNALVKDESKSADKKNEERRISKERNELTKCRREILTFDKDELRTSLDRFQSTGTRDDLLDKWDKVNERYDRLSEDLFKNDRLTDDEKRDYLERTVSRDEERAQDRNESKTIFSSTESNAFQMIKEGKR